MLTIAMLAIIGAFIFGFVLCGMFAAGAAADRSDRPKLDDGRDSLEGALLRAAHHRAQPVLVAHRAHSGECFASTIVLIVCCRA
jgi:hypothetical protein